MFNNYLFLIVDTLLTADAKNLYTEWETRNLNIVTYKCACVTLHNGPVPGPLSILHTEFSGFNVLPSTFWSSHCCRKLMLRAETWKR